MLPIAWCACRSCSTRVRRSALLPQASSRKAGHWSGARSRAARKSDLAWCSIAGMESSPTHRLYHSVRRSLGRFLMTDEKIPRPLPVRQQFAAQPRACVSPVPIRRGRRDAQGRGGLVESQTGKIAQLNEFTREGVQALQPHERVVQGNQLVGGDRGRYVEFLEIDALPVAAVLFPGLAASVLDEDAAHGLG